MNDIYFMGIDVGTFTSKGVITNKDLEIISQFETSHDIDNPKENYYEQDAEEIWWKDVCIVSRKLLEISKINPEKIKCLGVSALGCDCVPVDENCNPLMKAILYGIDSRSFEEIKYLNKLYGDKAEEVFGHSICSSDISPKILWIKNNYPEIHKSVYKFLTASSYLTAKLTGRYCIDKYLVEDFLPLYNLNDYTINEEMCNLYCRPDQLVEVLNSTDIAGYITAKASLETGLPQETKVIVGTGDSGAEAISTGVFGAGDMLIQLGSSCYIVYVSDQKIEENRLWQGKFIIPDTYCILAGTNTAGTLTKWFKDNIYSFKEDNTGSNPFTRMSEKITDIPPGSDGLITLPYFAGERTPINDPEAKGVVFGLKLSHTKNHMYKSSLEGIAYSIEQILDILKNHELPIKKIMIAGGGAKNEEWLKIISDVLGHEIHLSKTSIGASYGDAIMASVAVDFYDKWDDLNDILKPEKTYHPNPDNHKIYKKNKKIFSELYENTKELMHEL